MKIDWWTLALETINVLILVWLLARFLFKPVARIIARRQEEAAKLLSDAETAKNAAQAAANEAAKARSSLADERDKMLSQAREAASIEREAVLREARAAAQNIKAEGESQLARERAEAEQQLTEKASQLALDIAHRLLDRLPGTRHVDGFLEGLLTKLRALDPRLRDNLIQAANGGATIEILSAAPLADETADRCRSSMHDVFGKHLQLVFQVDPGVIGGLELRGPGIVISNSLRADLERLREQLAGHEAQR